MTATTTTARIDPQTQEELMRQAGIWIEHSTLIEDDLPARPLAAVQAEKHQLDRYTQLVADRAAARDSKCLAQIEEPAGAAPAAVAPCIKGLLDEDGENQAVRTFLMLYGTGLTVARMREHMELAGWPQAPEWALKPEAQGHLTKGGAQSWLRHLFALETNAPALEAPAAPDLPWPWMKAADVLQDAIEHIEGQDRLKDALRVLIAESSAAPVLHDIDAGIEVMAWLRENRAPHSIYCRMSACLFGDPDKRAALAAAPQAHAQETPAAPACERCSLPPAEHDATHWCENQSFAAAAPQAPAAPSGLPSGWVPCILTHDGQHPEEVAYGPQIMMDRLKKWLGRYFELLAQAAPAAPAVDASDTALLDALAAESMDLRCFDMPTGQGDADVGWRVIQHHMGEPTERVVSEVYKDDPRSAIRAAIARLERDPYCTGALHEEDAGLAAQAKEGGEA